MVDTMKVRQMMAERGITGKSVAASAGLAQGTISRVLITGNAKWSTLIKLAEALNVEPQELIRKE